MRENPETVKKTPTTHLWSHARSKTNLLVPKQGQNLKKSKQLQIENGRINNGAEFAYRWIKAKARGLVYQLVCFRFLTGGQITLVKTDARSHTLTFKNARWFSRFNYQDDHLHSD